MQLSELISQCASKHGVVPSNLSHVSFVAAVDAIDSTSSPLRNLDPARALARAALLRVANKVISYALPYLNLSLPEEKVVTLGAGADDFIDIVPTDLSPLKDEEDLSRVREGSRSGGSSPSSPDRSQSRGGGSGDGASPDRGTGSNSSPLRAGLTAGAAAVPRLGRRRCQPRWAGWTYAESQLWRDAHLHLTLTWRMRMRPRPAPQAGAQGWASPRQCLPPRVSGRPPAQPGDSLRPCCSIDEGALWEAILESTTTPVLHQDEYEDPREIKTVEINRVRANKGALSQMVAAWTGCDKLCSGKAIARPEGGATRRSDNR